MIIEERINENHIRRYSDKGVKIHNNKDGHDYDIAEDWSDEWFKARGLVAPTYTETDIPVDKEEIVEEETKDSDTYRA